jgi:hypothetical protein
VLGLVTMDDLLAQIFGVLRDERAELQNTVPMRRERPRTPEAGAAEAPRRDQPTPPSGIDPRDASVPVTKLDGSELTPVPKPDQRAASGFDDDEVTPPAVDVDDLPGPGEGKRP